MSFPAPPTPLQISYLEPDGGYWYLSDYSLSNGYVCSSIVGIEGFPISMQTIPLLDGTSIPNIYIPQPGTIVMAVLLTWPGNNENAYYDLVDRFIHAFYMRRNEQPSLGWLQIQRPDGSIRRIAIFTTSGLDTPEVGLHNMLFTLTFQTPDPFWQDVNSQSFNFTIGSQTGILPLFPISLNAPTIFGNVNIDNTGSAEAYPVWLITGPGTPSMVNNTSGRTWSLNTPIPAGQVVEVVTRPGYQSVVNTTTGVNIWDQLVLGGGSSSDLWSLMVGVNNVSISMSGATANTNVNVEWVNRYKAK
jgi:hypothetical protein